MNRIPTYNGFQAQLATLETHPSCWYAVYCKPRKETIAEENLQRQGYQVYLPRIRLPRRLRGQWAEAVEPLFPRYLFVYLNVDRDSVAPIRSTTGVTTLVRFAERPAVIPDPVIAALIANEDKESGLHLYGRPLFRKGESVRFLEGPFAGLQGIFDKENGNERVTVLLDLLGKLNTVRVSRSCIAPA